MVKRLVLALAALAFLAVALASLFLARPAQTREVPRDLIHVGPYSFYKWMPRVQFEEEYGEPELYVGSGITYHAYTIDEATGLLLRFGEGPVGSLVDAIEVTYSADGEREYRSLLETTNGQ